MIEIKADENIVAVYRKHKFILFLELLPIIFASALVVGVAFFLLAFLPEEMSVLIPLVLLMGFLMLHIFWVVSFIILADFYLDIWILTNKRVVSLEQKGLFARKTIEFGLDKVEDITIEVHGMIETFLDFGNVSLKTASENPYFVLAHVKNPNAVKETIVNEINKFIRQSSVD